MNNFSHNILILFFIPVSLLSSCRQKPSEAPSAEPIIIRFTEVKSMPMQLQINASGVLSSQTQSNLSFMTGGVLRKINVVEGSVVHKGQVLAELDLTEISSREKQARLGYEKASRDYRRIESLYADSIATLENLQDAKTALELALANLKIAAFNYDYSRITAPGNGKTLKKLKEVNEIIAPGHPVFVFASTEADWVLRVSLSDRDIVQITRDDSASVCFDAYSGKEFRAVVSEISEAANLLSGTYDAELKLIDLPERLVTGLIGSATIFPEVHNFPMVPYVSLVEASGKTAYIYVVKDDTAYRREIEVRAMTDEGIYIESGLTEGEVVVTEGASYLKNNTPVRTGPGITVPGL